MKSFLFLTLVFLAAGCSNNPTTVTKTEQVVTPKSLTFVHADVVKTLSITHTCTCPFPWNVSVLTATSVLKDTSGYGDNTKVPITIDRSKLTADTLKAVFLVKSAYGVDTVQVMVLK